MVSTQFDDAEEASFSLNGMVAGFDENTSAYAHMPTKNPYSHFCFALNIEMSAEEVIEELKRYLAELERGECREALCIEKKMLSKEYWGKNGLLRRNLLAMRERLEREKMVTTILKVQNGATYSDFIERLDNSYAEVARLLNEINQRLMKMTRKMYGNFYQHLKSQHDAEHAMMAYDEWMMTEGDYTFKALKGKQTLEVAEFLRKGFLRCLRAPMQSENDEVDIDKIIFWMPCNYDRDYLRSDDFRIQCAKFRKYCSWDGDILKLDYEELGRDLFKNFFKMTDEERKAFFDLDIMVELINKDIEKVMPDEEEVLDDDIDNEDLTERLKPIFYNNEDDVEIFLKEIKGMPPNDITDLVNRWVKEKRISNYGNSRKGMLWGILHKAQLYSKTKTNWNGRVK